MNIPDGEYEIDLSVFDEADDASAIAIRYGFIPDSMDQNSPLGLYQSEQVCIVEAQLVEKASKSGMRALPIIFEGVPQRQRIPLGNSSAATPSDSYFLSFLDQTGNGLLGLKVDLRRLGSAIRVSKSRNAEKWRTSIAEWKDMTKRGELTRPGELVLPPTASAAKPLLIEATSILKEKRNHKAVAPSISSPSPSKVSPTKKSAPPASKRPPTATPEIKADIISVSDFEDLESGLEHEFPSLDFTVDTKVKKALVSNTTAKQEKKPAVKQTQRQVKQAKQERLIASNIEMEDEFKDLEDQLEEVLEEAKPPQRNDSDSDNDSDAQGFSGGPIVIKVSEDKPLTRKTKARTMSSTLKPMSLRELYGGSKNDDLSSSEEE